MQAASIRIAAAIRLSISKTNNTNSMKTIKNTLAEYKAPKCKVVALTLGSPCLEVMSPGQYTYGGNGKAGQDGLYEEEGEQF